MLQDYAVHHVELNVSKSMAFDYIADKGNLESWTCAFKNVDGDRALLATPDGEVPISLKVFAFMDEGSVDWEIIFPDSKVAKVFTRLIELDVERCLYCFFLLAPPVPHDRLKEVLAQQSKVVVDELNALKGILEGNE